MIKNKYLDNIVKNALKNPIKIILPEQSDSRVAKAKNILCEMGFNILNIYEFSE